MSDVINIVASFSSGESSATMTILLKERYNCELIRQLDESGQLLYKYLRGTRKNGKQINIIVCMANTGREDIKSLEFADKCDGIFGLGVNYIESVVHHNTWKSSTGKRVEFKYLSKNGEPFTEVISKYGIPNQKFLHCTRELKTNPIKNWVKDVVGWKDFIIAIGYRIDEPKRFKNRKPGQVYPLTKMCPMTKPDINAWWSAMPFRLELLPHQGNCDLCHKKSTPKLLMRIHELITQGRSNEIDWWAEQQKNFENFTPETRTECNPPYRFYRGNLTIEELVEASNKLYQDSDPYILDDILLRRIPGQEISDCEESCEPFNETNP